MATQGTKGTTAPAMPVPRPLTALLATLVLTLMLAFAPALSAGMIGSAHADDVDASQAASTGAVSSGAAQSPSGGEGTAPIAGPVPNVIITNFSYGEGSVAVGSDFTLAFTFQNKGKVAVSNMVVTVDGGESFAIAGGTNTFYFDALYAGRSATQSVPMQALPAAKSGAQGVTVSFRYEYVDSGVRSSSSSDIKISVPVSQPDRFQLDDPVPPEDAMVGNETTITMNYVNKGKGDIANVEASIEGDGFDVATKTQYVGNVASGANGSIGFAFTPTQAGELQAKLHIAYEDSDGKAQAKDFPVTVTVADAAPMPEDISTFETEPQRQGMPVWAWAAVAVLLIGVVTLVVVFARRRAKRKAAQAAAEADDWDDWGKGDGQSGSSAGGVDGGGAAVPAGARSDARPTQIIAPVPVVPGDTSPSRAGDGSGISQDAGPDVSDPAASASPRSTRKGRA